MLTQQQTNDILTRSKNAGLSRDQAKIMLQRADTKINGVQPSYTQPEQPKDNRNMFQKAADFMGLGTTARNISTVLTTPFVSKANEAQRQQSDSAFNQSQALIKQAKLTTDPVKKQQLLNQSREIMGESGEKSDQFSKSLADMQNTMGITDKDLTRNRWDFAARRGLGQSAELASYVLPGAVTKGTTVATRIGSGAAKGAITGGLQGLARGTQADNLGEAIGETATGAFTGGLAGGAIQGGIEGIGAGINAIKGTGNKVGSKFAEMYKNTLKNNIRDRKFLQQYGGEQKVFEDAAKFGVPSTKEGVIAELERYKPEYNKIISDESARLQQEGKRINLSQAFKNAMSEIESKYGHDKTLLDTAKRWFEANKQYLNKTNVLPETANSIRVKLDQRVGDILTSDAAPADSARKAFATQLRKEFKNLVSSQTKDAITKYHLLSGLSEAMQKEPMTSLPELMGGALFGGNPLGRIAGMIGTKIVRSPGIRRKIATTAFNKAPSLLNIPQPNTSMFTAPISSAATNSLFGNPFRRR